MSHEILYFVKSERDPGCRRLCFELSGRRGFESRAEPAQHLSFYCSIPWSERLGLGRTCALALSGFPVQCQSAFEGWTQIVVDVCDEQIEEVPPSQLIESIMNAVAKVLGTECSFVEVEPQALIHAPYAGK